MGTYEDLEAARELFGLGEQETIKSIKKKINEQIKLHHPDTGGDNQALKEEKSISLIKAKKAIMGYVEKYRISFKADEVEKYLSPHERWIQQFGNDPIWGGGKE